PPVRPREGVLRMTLPATRAYGGQSMSAPLRRVLMRRPPADVSAWRSYGWRSEPDAARLAAEHEELAALLAEAGAEVVLAPPTTLDAISAYAPAIVADHGALLLRPGKAARRQEPAELEPELAAAGVPVAARLGEPAIAEGGDTLWLDERTLLVGI